MKNLKSSKPNNNFKTSSSIDPQNTIATFAKSKQTELEGKLMNNKYNENNNAMIIMSIVILALVILCSYTAFQIYNYEKKINSFDSSISDSKLTTWTGQGFSIIFQQQPPAGFVTENKEGDFEFLDTKKAKITSFVAKDTISGDSFVNGIIGYVSEYDNKMSHEDFTKKVLEVVGPNYILSDEKVAMKGDNVAFKIISKNKRENISFFVAVSSSNYYVFKTYNQGKDQGELNAKAKFVDELIPGIKLN